MMMQNWKSLATTGSQVQEDPAGCLCDVNAFKPQPPAHSLARSEASASDSISLLHLGQSSLMTHG